MIVRLNVNGIRIERIDNCATLIEKTQEFIKFQFYLSKDWENLKVFAQFQQYENAYNVYLDNNNSIYLPPEITNGIFKLMLCGTRNNVIAKTEEIFYKLDKSNLKEDTQSTDITPSLYNQLVNEFREVTSKEGERIQAEAERVTSEKERQEAEEQRAEVLFNKSDKVVNPIGNIPALTPDGNLADSGFSLIELEGKIFQLTKNGEEIATIRSAPLNISSWYDVQTIVRAGLARNYFDYGDILTCDKGNEVIEWEVIGIDEDIPSDTNLTHSLTLATKNVYHKMAFNVPEAAFIVEEDIPAGSTIALNTYYLHRPEEAPNYALNWFVTNNYIPAGSQMYFNTYYSNEFSNRVVKEVKFYESCASWTVLDTCITKFRNFGSGEGLDYFMFETCVARYSRKITPEIYRGSPEYSKSAVRKWLNSSEKDWNKFDSELSRPHWQRGTPGFLYNIESDFLEVVGTTAKLNDKFFVLSKDEVSSYGYFKSGGTLRKTYNGAYSRYNLRDIYNEEECQIFDINTDGTINHIPVNSTNGVVPCCCII